jgi:hypothetical protein
MEIRFLSLSKRKQQPSKKSKEGRAVKELILHCVITFSKFEKDHFEYLIHLAPGKRKICSAPKLKSQYHLQINQLKSGCMYII